MSVSACCGGCTELCQASVVLNAGSKHQSGIAWNTEPCKINLGSCGRLAFFLEYSEFGALLAFSCFCLQIRGKAARELQAVPVGNGNGNLHWKVLLVCFFSPEHEVCLLNSICFAVPFPQTLSLPLVERTVPQELLLSHLPGKCLCLMPSLP